MVRVRTSAALLATGLALGLVVLSAPAAHAATVYGPDLGTADTFGVLGAATVTNTGPTIIDGDLGLSTGSSITGFPPGVVINGTVHATDTTAVQAQADVLTAYNYAAGLPSTATVPSDLAGLSLTPGVYDGGALSLTGALTLAGTAESVWVFRASSTLTVASGASVLITGGASACNVFWQVGSSATLLSSAAFQGTVMAAADITAGTSATIVGRLLAANAVTLDSNVITAPDGCAPGILSDSPTITSTTPPSAEVGTDYSYRVTSTGTPTATYTVTSGMLPTGLTLNGTTGDITGRPTSSGTYTFTVTAANGVAPDAAAAYSIFVAVPAAVLAVGDEELAATGVDVGPPLMLGIALLIGGAFMSVLGRRGSRVRQDARA